MIARVVRDAVRIIFAIAVLIGLALFLGYAPVWSGLVIILGMVALVVVFLKRIDP